MLNIRISTCHVINMVSCKLGSARLTRFYLSEKANLEGVA